MLVATVVNATLQATWEPIVKLMSMSVSASHVNMGESVLTPREAITATAHQQVMKETNANLKLMNASRTLANIMELAVMGLVITPAIAQALGTLEPAAKQTLTNAKIAHAKIGALVITHLGTTIAVVLLIFGKGKIVRSHFWVDLS